MDENDQRSSVHRDGYSLDKTRKPAQPTTLWRMRSRTFDNQASCSVIVDDSGCDVLVVFAKGLGVPEHFSDVTVAMRHTMEIAGRLTAQGWVDLDLPD